MNRRNFIQNILIAGASFTILPGAGRIWKAVREVPSHIAFVDADGGYHYITKDYIDRTNEVFAQIFNLNASERWDLSWETYVKRVSSDPNNLMIHPAPKPEDPTTLKVYCPRPPAVQITHTKTEYQLQIVDGRPDQAKRIYP